MALCLTAVAVGLFVGLAFSLARGRALEPSTFALLGLVVILLGQGATPYAHPFGVGLLLGLASDTPADWARRHLRSGESVKGPALGQD